MIQDFGIGVTLQVPLFSKRLKFCRTDRISYFEPRAGLEARDDFSIQTGGVKGQGQLLWDALKLQLHLGTDFLETKENSREHRHMEA